MERLGPLGVQDRESRLSHRSSRGLASIFNQACISFQPSIEWLSNVNSPLLSPSWSSLNLVVQSVRDGIGIGFWGINWIGAIDYRRKGNKETGNGTFVIEISCVIPYLAEERTIFEARFGSRSKSFFGVEGEEEEDWLLRSPSPAMWETRETRRSIDNRDSDAGCIVYLSMRLVPVF